MLQLGIETHLTLSQADDIPLGQAYNSTSARELMHMNSILFMSQIYFALKHTTTQELFWK